MTTNVETTDVNKEQVKAIMDRIGERAAVTMNEFSKWVNDSQGNIIVGIILSDVLSEAFSAYHKLGLEQAKKHGITEDHLKSSRAAAERLKTQISIHSNV